MPVCCAWHLADYSIIVKLDQYVFLHAMPHRRWCIKCPSRRVLLCFFWHVLGMVACVYVCACVFIMLISAAVYHRHTAALSTMIHHTHPTTTGNNKPAQKKKLRRRVLFVIAHPDDESMFFLPTILALMPVCECFLLCLSTGVVRSFHIFVSLSLSVIHCYTAR